MGIYHNKKRQNWYSRFMFNGEIYKKEGFKSRSEAFQWEGRKREELEAPPLQGTLSISAHDLATEYLKNCKIRMQHNTVRQKSSVYRRLFAFLGSADIPVIEISPKQIQRFLNERATEKGNTAANNDLKDIKAMFNYGIRSRLIFENPCNEIEPFPRNKRNSRYIPPPEDVVKVRLAATGDESDLIETVSLTAGRRGEIVHIPDAPNESHAITWEDVNFEEGWVRLWTRKRRGGELEEDYLPLKGRLKEILQRRYRGRDKTTPYVLTFTEKQIRRMMHRLCEQAGVKYFGLHAIRHHVATMLEDAGKSTTQIQHVLRHRRRSTTEQYMHLMPRGLEDAFDTLEEKSLTIVTSGDERKASDNEG